MPDLAQPTTLYRDGVLTCSVPNRYRTPARYL